MLAFCSGPFTTFRSLKRSFLLPNPFIWFICPSSLRGLSLSCYCSSAPGHNPQLYRPSFSHLVSTCQNVLAFHPLFFGRRLPTPLPLTSMDASPPPSFRLFSNFQCLYFVLTLSQLHLLDFHGCPPASSRKFFVSDPSFFGCQPPPSPPCCFHFPPTDVIGAVRCLTILIPFFARRLESPLPLSWRKGPSPPRFFEHLFFFVEPLFFFLTSTYIL